MTLKNRRQFLGMATGMAGAAAAYAALPGSIRKAMEIPAESVNGSINDVQHVVILTQENRSFDHYFGTLRGVRGFGDRHPIPLPGGGSVWEQRDERGNVIRPFHLDTRVTSAQCVPDLPHNWPDAQGAANHGKWDQWVPYKAETYVGPPHTAVLRSGLTMGHYRREDIPFQFALAEAFTLCDAYHCSLLGSTTPNRIFLLAGTNDPHGKGGGPAIDNASGATPKKRADLVSKKQATTWGHAGWGLGPRYTFKTYPERLEQAGVSWKMYHDPQDPMDISTLVAFESFSWARPGSALWQKARTRHTLVDFKQDVINHTLPRVSWIVAPQALCEHPYTSSPIQGADFIQQVLEALTANPRIWGSSVLFVNFDENDGFFDHVPAPAAPSHLPDGSLAGASTIDIADELHSESRLLFGLGPRVPMYVISPWSKGGWVNSQVFDHTSIIRFLEKRFGVLEPNISVWRRAVCGDLTSAFDFAHPNRDKPAPLPDASRSQAVVSVQSQLPIPAPPSRATPLFQEPGTRPSRALPYELQVSEALDNGKLILDFINTGTAGAVFHVYNKLHLERIPRRYTVEAGKTLSDSWSLTEDGGRYHLWIYGPNGFLRELRGNDAGAGKSATPVVQLRYETNEGCVALEIINPGQTGCTVTLEANHYDEGGPWMLPLHPGAHAKRQFSIADSGHWYDFSVRIDTDPEYTRRFAGRMETGQHGISDPAMIAADQSAERIGARKDYFY